MRAGVTPDAVQVMPLALIGINVGMPVGARLTKALGPRATTLLATTSPLARRAGGAAAVPPAEALGP